MKYEMQGNNLPSENRVIEALEDYLSKQERPVWPSDAYKYIAKHFGLTTEQRNRKMADSNENHWENRVRQARRKLKDAGKLDPNLPRGQWALKKQFRK
jgi:hypothetical protein